MLGLPDRIQACLFDLDGVLTPTALVHAAAWKELFDEYLCERANRRGEPFVPFDPADDYTRYVDGKPRIEGARSFLVSRGITLPEPGDPTTVESLAAHKDWYFGQRLHRDGVRPYPGSVRYLEAARDAGLRRAVVSSSKHCVEVLQVAGLHEYVEVVVDGVQAERNRLAGKPAPDTFLAAAHTFGLGAADSAVFEDALAGVEAGRAGGFGAVVGVDRGGAAEALTGHGATMVVADLADLLDKP